MTRTDIQTLKENTSLRQLAEEIIGTPVKRNAQRDVYYAPTRKESTPSLHVLDQYFIDFGDPEKKGDVFNFLAIYAGMDFQEALTFLNKNERQLRATSPRVSNYDREERTSASWRKAHEKLVAKFQDNLALSPSVRSYLIQQGYTPQHIEASRIGYNPSWHKTPYGSIAPGIVYPRYDSKGQLVALKIRCPHAKDEVKDTLAQIMGYALDQKYMSAPGSKPNSGVYGNLDQYGAPIIITEGEKDCDNVALRLHSSYNVVTMGAAGTRFPAWAITRMLELAPEYILIIRDNDEAGEKGARIIFNQLKDAGIVCPIFVSAPPANYKDITDAILDGLPVDRWVHLNTVDRFDDRAHIGGIPDNIRRVLLNIHQDINGKKLKLIHNHHTALMILEIWHKLVSIGLIGADMPLNARLFMEAASRAGHQLVRSQVYNALQQLAALGQIVVVRNFDPIEKAIQDKYYRYNFQTNKPGVDGIFYVLPYKDEARYTLLGKAIYYLRYAIYAQHGLVPRNVPQHWFGDDRADISEQWRALTKALESSDESYTSAYIRAEEEYEFKRQALLNLLDEHYSPLSVPIQDHYDNAKAYRAALYRAKVAQAGGKRQISRRQLTHELGISKGTIKGLREDANIISEEKFAHHELQIETDPQRPDVVLEQVRKAAMKYAPWQARSRRGVWVEAHTEDGKVDQRRLDNPHLDQWVHERLTQGDQLKLKVQVASVERFATPEEVAAQVRARKEAQKAHRERAAAKKALYPEQDAEKERKRQAEAELRRQRRAELPAPALTVDELPSVLMFYYRRTLDQLREDGKLPSDQSIPPPD